jgi:hypothetical protein
MSAMMHLYEIRGVRDMDSVQRLKLSGDCISMSGMAPG